METQDIAQSIKASSLLTRWGRLIRKCKCRMKLKSSSALSIKIIWPTFMEQKGKGQGMCVNMNMIRIHGYRNEGLLYNISCPLDVCQRTLINGNFSIFPCFYQSIYLSIFLSFYLSIFLSFFLSFYPSVNLPRSLWMKDSSCNTAVLLVQGSNDKPRGAIQGGGGRRRRGKIAYLHFWMRISAINGL